MRVEGQWTPAEFFPTKREGAGSNKASNNQEKENVTVKDSKSPGVEAPKILKSEVNTANEALKIVNSHLQFRLHEGSGRYQVKVIDTNTDEVIREIPPESVLEFAANIRQMLDEAIGLLVDEIA